VVDLVLTDARVVTPDGIVQGGLAIEAGIIVAVGAERELPVGSESIGLDGAVVLPGLIDPHVHLGVGGTADEAKLLEDMATETAAAAIGGVTTIVTDHENANGPCWITTLLRHDGETLLARAKREAAARSPIDFRFTANPSRDEHLDEVPKLVDEGVTSFKMFPSYVGVDADEFGIETVEYGYIFRALERISASERDDRPTQGMVHCEEPTICGALKSRFQREGRDGLEWWTRSRPSICEAMQIFDLGMMALETGARAYVPHVSSGEGARAIAHLRQSGVRIVGETCPQYLLDEVDWGLGALGKVNPPLRGGSDATDLWTAIDDGAVTAVGSDNCRYPLSQKQGKSIWEAIPGISEIGATLPLLITEGVRGRRLDWTALAGLTAEAPARAFGMFPRKGVLAPGSDADIVVVNPDERWVLGADVPLSGADWSIYEGREVFGRPMLTISRGRIVSEQGRLLASSGGRYVADGGAVAFS
jgi:dihydropyrimidinase